MTDRSRKSLLVKIFQWLYLLLGIASVGFVYFFQNHPYFSRFQESTSIPPQFIWGLAAVAVVYCLILFISFFLQNSGLLIISFVFIFLTTIGAIGLLIAAAPNAGSVFQGGLPSCATNLSLCSLKDGLTVASAGAMVVAIPLLVLNLLTIVAAVKALSDGE